MEVINIAKSSPRCYKTVQLLNHVVGNGITEFMLLSGVPDYFYRNKISSGGDLSHYSSASLY